MTRVFLIAGVAALAITAPASAQRDSRGKDDNETSTKRDRGGERVKAEGPKRTEVRAERRERASAKVERPQRAERVAQRAERSQRVDRVEQRVERRDRVEPARLERQAQRIGRTNRVENRLTERQQVRADRIDRIEDRMADRADVRIARASERVATRDVALSRRLDSFRNAATVFPIANRARGSALIEGCPPGLWMKHNNCMPPGQAAKLIGAPLATASGIMTLNALPQQLQYYYPDTDDYYYRYGDGYLYQVDRSDNLIMSLLPLIAGGYIPGQYLPTSYRNSYVPSYYGLNSFYADSQYSCNRYADGVVYQIDCATGMIEGVVPLYASGYGVGQMLPSAYGYYNVPSQYRSLYYDNDDYGYRYAPGAIYQYDHSSNLITSVAALLTPGFGIGQPLPVGYDVYNVPYGYRDNYFDTSDSWYRYNNGNIYQIDPTTQLVTAIVASILT